MKEILFVMNTMGRAGAERALIALMNTLPREKYHISLLVLVARGEVFDEIPKHVTVLNQKTDNRSVLSFGGTLAIIRTTFRCFFYHLQGFKLLPYLLKNLIKQLKSHQFAPDKLLWRLIAMGTKTPPKEYDLAVAYLEGGSTYFVADKVYAKKKASFIHIDYEKAGYGKSLDLDSYRRIDRIFSVSREAGESFLKIYPEHREKLFLFRNIIDTAKIKKYAKEPVAVDCPFAKSAALHKLLTVGRLTPQKAYDIAIPALKLLRERGIDADWFVLGEGPLKKELTDQIEQNGLAGHFVLLGSKRNPYPYYRAADIYVHATRFEGKSVAIEEAQVLGKAIIASDCTGNREQIADGENGMLIPLSAKHIADSIEFLLKNPAQKEQFEIASASIDLTHAEDMDAFYELL